MSADVFFDTNILIYFSSDEGEKTLRSETHLRGLTLAERHNFAIYDAMIVAAAQLAGCRTLYTEDLHDGHVLDGLRIVNPYA